MFRKELSKTDKSNMNKINFLSIDETGEILVLWVIINWLKIKSESETLDKTRWYQQ